MRQAPAAELVDRPSTTAGSWRRLGAPRRRPADVAAGRQAGLPGSQANRCDSIQWERFGVCAKGLIIDRDTERRRAYNQKRRSEERSGPEMETAPLGGERDSRRWGVPLNANAWRSL